MKSKKAGGKSQVLVSEDLWQFRTRLNKLKMHINRYPRKSVHETDNTQVEIHSIQSVSQEMEESDFAPVFHGAYSFVWIKRGSGEIAIDLDKYAIEEQYIYFARPGQTVMCTVNEPATGLIISFSKEFLDLYERDSPEITASPLLNHFISIPAIKINDDMNRFFEKIGEEMVTEFKNFLNLRHEILKGLLKLFILYLSRGLEQDPVNTFQSRKGELVNTFYHSLEKNYTTKKMVREYAEILAVTPGYLNETVKELSGFSVSHHIQQRLILEAKRRAVYEGCSMKEIAYYLGFWDPSHFSKFFKTMSGLNFTDFKKGVSGRPVTAENVGSAAHELSQKLVA